MHLRFHSWGSYIHPWCCTTRTAAQTQVHVYMCVHTTYVCTYYTWLDFRLDSVLTVALLGQWVCVLWNIPGQTAGCKTMHQQPEW